MGGRARCQRPSTIELIFPPCAGGRRLLCHSHAVVVLNFCALAGSAVAEPTELTALGTGPPPVATTEPYGWRLVAS